MHFRPRSQWPCTHKVCNGGHWDLKSQGLEIEQENRDLTLSGEGYS